LEKFKIATQSVSREKSGRSVLKDATKNINLIKNTENRARLY